MPEPEIENTTTRIITDHEELALFRLFWKWLAAVGTVIFAAVTAISVLLMQSLQQTAINQSTKTALAQLDSLQAQIAGITRNADKAQEAAQTSLQEIMQSRGRSEQIAKDAEIRAEESKLLVGELKNRISASEKILNASNDIKALSESISNDGNFRSIVSSQLQSNFRGVIAAFDRENGCPEGWLPFTAAGGRIVVGAGSHNNLDGTNQPLTVYDIGKTGGEQQHRLTLTEMPAHQHDTIIAVLSSPWGTGETKANAVFGTKAASMITGLTSPAGAAKPNPLPLPPFIALRYCQKI